MEQQFEEQVSSAFIVFTIVLAFAPIVLVVLGGLLMPGRKGRMRTTRDGEFPGDEIDRVWQLLAERLIKMGFKVKPPTDLGLLRASRSKRQIGGIGALEMHTHASKPLEAELRLQKDWSRIEVQANFWTNDFVIVDTGEGRHIDQCLDRLLASESDDAPPEPEPVPNVTMKATTSLAAGVLLLVASVAQLLPWFTLPRAIGLILGFGMGVLSGVVLGVFGWIDTIRKPKEIKGGGIALMGIALTLLAAVIAFYIFYQAHGPEFIEWFTKHEH